MNQKHISKPDTHLRPPVVVVLGHVDHGKTTLLDTIRNTHVTEKEQGGITQHIGAYQIEVSADITKKVKTKINRISFIDTPGHEAFATMRQQGTQVADIAILVIAGNDGIMPQTLESLQYIKEVKVPMIICVNKIDLPDVNLDKLKKKLTQCDVALEEYGGDTPLLPISAKQNQGIDKLLEMILFLADLHQIQEKQNLLEAIVIESSLSKQQGITATVVLRNGSMHIGQKVICANDQFRIRAMFNWTGTSLKEITAGTPAIILGWNILPLVGSKLHEAISNLQSSHQKNTVIDTTQQINTTLSIPAPSVEKEKIKIVLKADTTGTLSAIVSKLSQHANIIVSGVGAITESDVLLAKTTKAIIIGFQVAIRTSVSKLAESERVLIKTYNIIYELFDDVDDVIEAIRVGRLEKVLGEAKIITIFEMKTNRIAGVKIISGKLAVGDQIKIIRNNSEVVKAKIKSIHLYKENIKEAKQGMEVGILLSQKLPILTDDSIISIG